MIEVDHFRVDVEGISISPRDRFHPQSLTADDIEEARALAYAHAEQLDLRFPRVEVSAVSEQGVHELAYVVEGHNRAPGPLFPDGPPTRERPSSLAERALGSWA